MNPKIARIMLLLIAPKNNVNSVPPIKQPEANNQLLTDHDLKNILKPTKSDKETKNKIVETVKSTENFRRFNISKDIIDKIPAKIAHTAVIPNPIILSEYDKCKQPVSSGCIISAIAAI